MAVPAVESPTAAYVAARWSLLAPSAVQVSDGTARRRALSDLTDGWLRSLFAAAVGGEPAEAGPGLALVAVGGYGTGHLSPGSDLDLVLLHSPGVDLPQRPGTKSRRKLAEVADAVWYPIWDSGVRLDHSVRTPEEARRLARRDVAVLLGLLDARTVAGDAELLGQVRARVLADWRADARKRLPELRDAARSRAERYGDLAYVLEPDLKLGRGGLRDLTVLRAVAASWVADRPHTDLAVAQRQLLNIRDALHLVTGRPSDRLQMQDQAAVAERLGLPGPDELLQAVSTAGRAIAYAGDVTWRRVEHVLRAPARRPAWRRGPVLRPLAGNLLECNGEVVLATASGDPWLPMRIAAAAARTRLSLSPETLAELGTTTPAAPAVWPDDVRGDLLDLLRAGHAAIPLWEALDSAGLVVRLLPEWSAIRNKRQRNPVHAWTVDRHSWETAARAATGSIRVARPDLLLIAALLHDLGKGVAGKSHAVAGEELVRSACVRLGLPPEDVALVGALSRHHLLLADTAMHRDVAAVATVAEVAEVLGSVQMLDLLAALTEADARATGPTVWTSWKAGLVEELTRGVRAELER